MEPDAKALLGALKTLRSSTPTGPIGFAPWLLQKRAKLSAGLFFVLVSYTAYRHFLSYLSQVSKFLGSDTAALAAFNLAVCLIALCYYNNTSRFDDRTIDRLERHDPEALARSLGVRDDEKWQTRARQADTVVLQFSRSWLWVWLTWVCFYALQVLAEFLITNSPGSAEKSLFDFLEWLAFGANSLMFLSCFLVMWRVTVDENAQPTYSMAPYFAFAFVIALVDLAVRGLHVDPRWLDGLNGGLGAVVLAMFVGRLESKYINAPISVIVLLYFYAAIQPLYFAYQGDKVFHDIILLIALFLKVVLFTTVLWAMESGRLLFYMARVRSLQDHVEGDRGVFAECFGLLRAEPRPAELKAQAADSDDRSG